MGNSRQFYELLLRHWQCGARRSIEWKEAGKNLLSDNIHEEGNKHNVK